MFQTYTQETLDRGLWKELAKDSLYNQADWLSVWETLGFKSLYFLSHATQSGESAHAFSCVRLGSGLWSRAQAGVNGLAGRLLPNASVDFPIEDDVRDEIFRALKQSGRIHSTWVDYQGRMNPEKLPKGWKAKWVQTHRLEFTPEAPALSAATARHIKSGYERGSAVFEINDISQVERCYELMQKTYQRFGRSRMYPREFYRRLFEYSRVQQRIRWYICQVDGNIIGSLIALIEGNEALIWEPFIDRQSSEYKPAYVMYARLFEDARKLQLCSVNLGGSPPGADGLIAFKERFGATVYSYPVFFSQTLSYRLYNKFRT